MFSKPNHQQKHLRREVDFLLANNHPTNHQLSAFNTPWISKGTKQRIYVKKKLTLHGLLSSENDFNHNYN